MIKSFVNGELRWNKSNVKQNKEILEGRFIIGQSVNSTGMFVEDESFVGALTQFYVWNGGVTGQLSMLAFGCSDSKLLSAPTLAWPDMRQWTSGNIDLVPAQPCIIPGM